MTSYTQGWYFSKKDLMKPLKEGGTDWETAVKYRQAMYLFITKLGRLLDLPQLTQSTSEVYFHRFFARRDFIDHDRHIIATACLFLATKVEEVHRKLADVLQHSYEVQHNEKLVMESEKYTTFRQQVLVAERLVLQTIAFDLTVEHPHRFLQEQGFLIACKEEELCLQFRPQLIAAAAIYLAAKNHKIELKSNGDKEWWQCANVNLDDLTDTTTQILEASNTTSNSSSNPPSSNKHPQNSSSISSASTTTASSSAGPTSHATANPSRSPQHSGTPANLPPGQRLKRKEPDFAATPQ